MKKQINHWVSNYLKRLINWFCLADDDEDDIDEEEQEKENINPATDSDRPSLKVNSPQTSPFIRFHLYQDNAHTIGIIEWTGTNSTNVSSTKTINLTKKNKWYI